MSSSFMTHNVAKIEVDAIGPSIGTTVRRCITVRYEDGTRLEITLFAETPEALEIKEL